MVLPWDKLKQLVALYTDHYRLKYHLHKLGICPTNQYRFCELATETPEHILFYFLSFLYFLSFPAFARGRSQDIGAVYSLREHVNLIAQVRC